LDLERRARDHREHRPPRSRKIPDARRQARPGTRGISLFIVPKKLVGPDGALTGERNDVALAGLNHKLGYRGIPNTLLNFGERQVSRRAARAGRSLLGRDSRGQGLRCMFHMMNEARIAAWPRRERCSAYAGYEASLEYAKTRPQGGPIRPGGKDARSRRFRSSSTPTSSACCSRRRATAKAPRARAYGAKLVDELHTAMTTRPRRDASPARRLTPIAKSWPSEWCLEANSLAILGPRRLRLHARLSGRAVLARQPPQHDLTRARTHQALDLLGRKVVMDAARPRRRPRGDRTRRSRGPRGHGIAEHAEALRLAADDVATADSRRLVDPRSRPKRSPNATPYLQAFGHLVWRGSWLDVATCAAAAAPSETQRGRLAACRYFLPLRAAEESGAWLGVSRRPRATTRVAPCGDRSFWSVLDAAHRQP
jgi:butyryl-CoA dehydrogenase